MKENLVLEHWYDDEDFAAVRAAYARPLAARSENDLDDFEVELLVYAAKPLWDLLERRGLVDGWGGREFIGCFQHVLRLIGCYSNHPFGTCFWGACFNDEGSGVCGCGCGGRAATCPACEGAGCDEAWCDGDGWFFSYSSQGDGRQRHSAAAVGAGRREARRQPELIA